MSILSTEKVSHSFGDKWLFKDLNFGLQKGDRVALVGANGTGKTTLLNILAEQFTPNEGKVVKESGIRIGYLNQSPDFQNINTIEDFIFSDDNPSLRLIIEYNKILDNRPLDQQELDRLTHEMTIHEAWDYEHKFKSVLNRLGITNYKQSIDTLSGGQKKRLSLAKLLIEDPDIYILDEPTNHLDIDTIEWLEKMLNTGNKTVVVVTHDRYFLDNVCNEIRELSFGKVYLYKGNYRYFLEKKAERESIANILSEKAKNLLRKELEWMRRQPQARGTKSKSRIEAYYDLEERAKDPSLKSNVSLSIQMSRQGSKIIEVDRINKSFGDKVVIKDFSYVFKKFDRIGLVGINGSGKSTFLNILAQKIDSDSGKTECGETTKIGYYTQTGLSFKEDSRVIDIVTEVAEHISMSDGKTISASQLLNRFLFPPEKQYGLVSKLSGGEKKRLHLMRVLMDNPNFLILDEPSNDLDIDTLNILEEFLIDYSGVLILVSHDRYLVDKICDQLFIFNGKGGIKIFNGNYADYKEEEEEKNKTKKEKETPKPIPVKTSVSKPKLSYKEVLEFSEIELKIKNTEEKIAKQSEILNTLNDYEEITKLATLIEEKQKDLDHLTERWIYLAEHI